MSIWPLLELLAAELHRRAAVRDHVAERAFAFAQVVIAGQRVLHVLEGAERDADVARGGGFLLGGADVLRGLEFATEKDRLRDPAGEAPGDRIEHADAVECRACPARSWR